MFGTKVWGAFFASVMFGLVAAAVGCEDAELNETGNSKGTAIVMTAENGRPTSASASAMSQSTGPAGATLPTFSACSPGGTCFGAGGCLGVCDPASALITACASCAEGVFADCTERTCQP